MVTNALEVVLRTLQERAHHLTGVIDRNHHRFGDEWVSDFNHLFGLVFKNQEDLQRATEGYVAFSNSTLRSQARFQKTGKYEETKHEAVAGRVYLNPAYMHREYLPGLLLSHFLWPHHYAQLRFFKGIVHRIRPSQFVEVGVGSGIYSLSTLLTVPETVGFGIDISPSSLEFAQSLMQRAGCGGRYQSLQHDVSVEEIELSPDLAISVELLEHLENPVLLLQGLRKIVSGNRFAFITAALNAAHTDHIYLYSSVEQVQKQIESVGFTVSEIFCEEAYKQRNKQELVPAIVAFVVTAS